jgi:uncharacterized membrane protein YfcA
MGLIIMTGVALFAITDIAFAAAVVSFISLVNTLVALRKGYRFIDTGYVRWILAGSVPAMALGLLLLAWLSEYYYDLLKLMLGFVIILGGCLLMISPAPREMRSSRLTSFSFGAAGGVLAGLYSASGAPLAYFMYRQPLDINAVRFSLLAVFAATTGIRSIMVAGSGQMTSDIVMTSLLAVPLVIVVTLLTSRVAHLVPDHTVRVMVFMILLLAGLFLITGSLDLTGQLFI